MQKRWCKPGSKDRTPVSADHVMSHSTKRHTALLVSTVDALSAVVTCNHTQPLIGNFCVASTKFYIT